MTKSRTLYAYKIINGSLANRNPLLKEHLIRKLTSDVDSFGNRCKEVQRGSTTQDVLACFMPVNQNSENVSGEMWRIAPTKDMPKIPQTIFNQETASVMDIPNDPSISDTDKSCLDTHYFLVTDRILITTFSPVRTVSFARYLNKLLTVYRGRNEYKFDPLIILPSNIKLSDISYIVFQDIPERVNGKVKNMKSKYEVFKTGVKGLKNLFSDFKNVNQLIDQKILSASMTMKLKKPKNMTDEDYTQKLSAFLKPLSTEDVEGVVFKLTDGREIKSLSIQAKKQIDINNTDPERTENLQNMNREMQSYYQSLRL